MQYLHLLTEFMLFTLINSNDSPSMSGFYTDGLDKVIDNIEIVYPEKVAKDGSFVSHYLPHFYDIESVENRPRRTSGNTRARREDTVHFYVPIDGESNHLELWPNLNFISPSLVVERRDARDVDNVNKAKITQISSKQCHYNGHIVGKPDSSVALSTCYGLAGYIRVPEGEEYLIEPVKDSKPEPGREHPHIIYKRSAMKEGTGGSNCLTKGRAKDALEERKKWEAMFGDQVRQELSGTDINELVRDNTGGQKQSVTLEEKSRYFDKNPIITDNHNDIDAIPLKNVQAKMEQHFSGESQSENLDKESRKNLYHGNKLKQKSILVEKSMGNIKLPEDRLKSLSPGTPDKSLLREVNDNNLKGVNRNEGKVFKRDLNLETKEYSKLNTDKQNYYQGDKSSKSGCEKMIDSQDYDEKNNKLENTNKVRRDVLSNDIKPEFVPGGSDRSIITSFQNNKENNLNNREQSGSIEQNGQAKNEQIESKETADSQFNSVTKQERGTSHLNNENHKNSKESVMLNAVNNIDTSDQSWKVDDDVTNVKLTPDKTYSKRYEQDVSRELLSDQSSSIKKNEGIGKAEKFGNVVQQKSINANEESSSITGNAKASEENLNLLKKQKTKLEHSENLASNLQLQTNSNSKIDKGDSSLFGNSYKANNNAMVNDKSQMPIPSDNNKEEVSLNKGSDSDLATADSPEIRKHSEKDNLNRAQDIVIRINIQDGSDVKNPSNDVPAVNNIEHLEKNSVPPLGENENKRGISDNDYSSNLKNKLSIDKGTVNGLKGFQPHSFKDAQAGEGSNANGRTKVKRHDNTIHLIIETAPEVNADVNSEPKNGLFCQGNNCLEIKPVLLNQPSSNSSGSNNSTNNTITNNVTQKIVQKRQAVDTDECTAGTTTEKPLLCFDLYNKLFNLELMVAVDSKVVKMHDDDDIENFILTVINMVSTNFVDKTIGINLSVILVRLILLTTCIKELDSDRFNPDELLENFCTWQTLINPGKDDHPHHHDLAILVTRMDKCEGQVMGVTYMTSICRPDKACLVCVDEGLLLANTITHQIGHSLGAEHDDGEASGCASYSSTGTPYHMGPTISETSSAWSPCSKDAIIQFVKTQGSWCLTDIPVDRSFNFPLMLPGQIYSAAQQCKLNFHMTSIPCAVGSFCEKMYCQVTDKICATKGDPPADGTFCAADMWCFHKQCVHIGRRPGAINGEWGPWTEWSVCTRSCGGGVSTSYRICNNPKPANGGRFCIGDRIRHRMCATRPCQGFTESFRDLQCKKTEDKPFRGRFHNWIQYHSHFINIECALVCQNRKGNVVMRSPIVADGTPCKAGTRNVCIQGTCRNVGCDWVIDSNAKEDACGICHGNSTECKIIQGIFDEPTAQKGLVEFLRIPKNSGMVFVREIRPSSNIIVVSGAINRVFYLNGVGSEDSMPGDVIFGLTHGVYEVRSLMERIFIRGPTTEDLIFYVLFRETNKGIHYQFAIRETDPSYIPRYLWQYLDWDTCTEPCSGGSQRAHAKCVEDRGGVVDDQYCTETTRPMDVIRPCNDFPCMAKWWVSVWSDCVCTGSSSVMFRSVLCMRSTDESGTRTEIVKEAECAAHKKPPTQKPCNVTEEDSECFKRSADYENLLGSRKYVRRAVSPKTAYNAFSPGKEMEIMEGREQSSSTKIQRNAIKPQIKKGKITDGSSNLDKNNTPLIDNKNNKSTITKDAKALSYKDDMPIGSDKGKQLVKLKMKNSDSLGGISSTLKNGNKARESEEPQQKSEEPVNQQSAEKQGDNCASSTKAGDSGSCPTQEKETTEPSTCKITNPVQPHQKTTCCKTTPRRMLNLKTDETTTLRPVVVKMEELNMDTFGLTVVPIDLPNKKKLPLTDPEFINLGQMGQFGVGDETNGTILSGQEAVDFLDFARSNASEEPVVLHEEMMNN